MSETIDRIAALSAERQQIYHGADGRGITHAEQARLTQIASALYDLWQQRRRELAALPEREHELIVRPGGVR